MRALALFSGGLDSMLAVKLTSMQGIDVIALHIDIGFGGVKSKEEILRKRAQKAGATLQVIDVRDAYVKSILFNPKYGYGKHFNPCIDCHGFMFKTAKYLLKKYEAQFIVTGEVLGQRPMSQRAQAIKSVNKLAENEDDLIVRPLCARLMDETTPEKKRWIDREKLLDIHGRGRQRQLALAKEFGFDEYETPGGGCLLTLESFANKIRDFIKYDTLQAKDIDLLKFGRHFRLPGGAKLVIGRDQKDNEALAKIKNEKHDFIELKDVVGGVSLMSKSASQKDITLAIQFVLMFARTKNTQEYKAVFMNKEYTCKPFFQKEIAKQYYIS